MMYHSKDFSPDYAGQPVNLSRISVCVSKKLCVYLRLVNDISLNTISSDAIFTYE